jgi:hypothetical protein
MGLMEWPRCLERPLLGAEKCDLWFAAAGIRSRGSDFRMPRSQNSRDAASLGNPPCTSTRKDGTASAYLFRVFAGLRNLAGLC